MTAPHPITEFGPDGPVRGERIGPRLLFEVLPKNFIQHQHFALLALHESLKAGYHGLEQMLKTWTELRETLGLKEVPAHSTIQRAAVRAFEKGGPLTSCGGRCAA